MIEEIIDALFKRAEEKLGWAVVKNGGVMFIFKGITQKDLDDAKSYNQVEDITPDELADAILKLVPIMPLLIVDDGYVKFGYQGNHEYEISRPDFNDWFEAILDHIRSNDSLDSFEFLVS